MRELHKKEKDRSQLVDLATNLMKNFDEKDEKYAAIKNMLAKIHDRWEYLKDLIRARLISLLLYNTIR